jgi:hypothetical protein
MSFVVAVVGATGAVGREMLRTLEQRNFPVSRLVPLASKKSAGQKLRFRGEDVEVLELGPASFAGVDVALFSAGGSVSKEYGPIAAKAGALVVDNSQRVSHGPRRAAGGARGERPPHPDAPAGIVANPNCSTIQMLVALKPAARRARASEHVVVSTYQAIERQGRAGRRRVSTRSSARALGQAGAALGAPRRARVQPALRLEARPLGLLRGGAQDGRREPQDPGARLLRRLAYLRAGARRATRHSQSRPRALHAPHVRARGPRAAPRAPGRGGRRPRRPRASTRSRGTCRAPTPCRGPRPRGPRRPARALPVGRGDNLRKGAALNAVQVAERGSPHRRVAREPCMHRRMARPAAFGMSCARRAPKLPARRAPT